ncbi:MAG: hypothetical protein BroJett040_05070 [Oligoflexia bacterium]|nr:MAG: hypothetical protein BroJett040_05070 [Oligoflexia bacterium]
MKEKELGTYLKTKRESKGLTQSDVASKLGYGSPQFISNIERGISSVPLKSLKVLIDLYELNTGEIVDILLTEKRTEIINELGLKE